MEDVKFYRFGTWKTNEEFVSINPFIVLGGKICFNRMIEFSGAHDQSESVVTTNWMQLEVRKYVFRGWDTIHTSWTEDQSR